MPRLFYGRSVAYPAVLLLLLTAGCGRVKPVTPGSESNSPATQPDTPPPAKSEAPGPGPAAAPPPKAGTPAPQAARKAPPAAKTPAAAKTLADAKTPPAAAALDVRALTEQLKGTKAIGFFTKLTLKNQVDDLLDQFREYHEGKATLTKTDLRRSYDLLLMKVLSLLQDKDPTLASAIVSSREAIWNLLADPKKFATLQS